MNFSGRVANVKPRRGFTLIELLVVISIIGLLASVVMASLNSARGKARNAAEKAEVKEIIKALELARSSNPQDKYPLSAGGGAGWSCLKASGTCWRGSYSALPAQAVTDLSPYLSALPLTAVKTDTSCYAHDSYLYISNSGPIGPTGAGAYLIWAKETTGAFDSGECVGYDAGIYDCGLRYCYQYLGSN